jgi:histidinol-phosphate aminotransferase
MKFKPPRDPADALRLHYNENTAGCSPAVIAALRALTPDDIATYPDYTDITANVARWFGVPTDRVTLTNGLDDGLHAVAEWAAWHADDRPHAFGHGSTAEFVVAEPAFEMFEEFTGVVRAKLVRVAPGDDFRFPLTDVLDAITPATRVVYLIDPNNPTGLPLPLGAAEAIAAAAPHALVLVDEAYADFSGRTLVGEPLDRHPNIVVGRTFAKAHGLAGLRVGALVAHEKTMERLKQVQPPFHVNIAAVRALEAALADREYLAWSVAQAADSREMAFGCCVRLGLKVWPSVGNFVLIRIGDRVGEVTAALASRGILARDKSAAPGCAGCLRVTTGVVEHTARMLAALEEILASRTN